MTIGHVAVSDSGATVRAKINAAIDAANEVAGKADAASVAAAIEAEADARAQADADEVQARQNGDAAVRRLLAPVNGWSGRLAEMGLFATAATAGKPEDVTPLGAGAYGLSPMDGAVVVLAGAATVAPIALTRIEPGRVYRARYVLRRVVDTADPDGDGVRLALHWHTAAMAPLSVQVLEDLLGIAVVSGRQEHTFTFAVADDGQVQAVAPAGGLYVRPFIQTYGSGTTHALLAQIEDITTAVDWSPDVAEFRNGLSAAQTQISLLQSGVSDLQEQVAAFDLRARQAAYQEIDSNADILLSVGASATVIRHTGTLTAVRRAVLNTVDAIEGQTFRMVRTGSGAYPLNVRNGATTLKAMMSATWAEFTFDGTGWFLSASGTL